MLTFYISMLETEEQQDKFSYIYQNYVGFMYHVAKEVVKEHYLAEDVELLQGKVCRTSFYTTNVLGRYIKLVAQFFLCPSLCCTHCANLCSNRFV